MFKQWKSQVDKKTKKNVKQLKTNNMLELFSDEINELCENEDITRHRTIS